MQYIDVQEQNEVAAWVETAVRRLVHELAPEKIIPTAVGIGGAEDGDPAFRH